MMLIKRSRIAKTASAKIILAKEVLTRHFQRGQYWLVYCDSQEQLNEVMQCLRQEGLPVNEYHSAMAGDPEQTLIWYSKYGGILVSIRCLDEGVDIPLVSHALILASSQNPREYIQRRGRVLRVPHNPQMKSIAVIHDALVMPSSLGDEPSQTSLAKSEIARALEFGSGAINRGAVTTLLQVAVDIGLQVDELVDVGLEGDDDDE
jgi:superfamily II DNA or RNA helicase